MTKTNVSSKENPVRDGRAGRSQVPPSLGMRGNEKQIAKALYLRTNEANAVEQLEISLVISTGLVEIYAAEVGH